MDVITYSCWYKSSTISGVPVVALIPHIQKACNLYLNRKTGRVSIAARKCQRLCRAPTIISSTPRCAFMDFCTLVETVNWLHAGIFTARTRHIALWCYTDGLVQGCHNSIDSTLELLQSCSKSCILFMAKLRYIFFTVVLYVVPYHALLYNSSLNSKNQTSNVYSWWWHYYANHPKVYYMPMAISEIRIVLMYLCEFRSAYLQRI